MDYSIPLKVPILVSLERLCVLHIYFRCVCLIWETKTANIFYWIYQFDLMRTDLFSQLADVPGFDITSMDSKDLCEFLLYRNSHLNVFENRMIIEATTSFIERSKRFC